MDAAAVFSEIYEHFIIEANAIFCTVKLPKSYHSDWQFKTIK
jgi:hypothetical protein